MRGKIRTTWGELTDDDFERVGGSFDKLVGLIKEKMAKPRKPSASG